MSGPSSSARPAVLVAVLALVTGLLGIAAVLAPVQADDPVLTWPRAGEAPTSTVVPLTPYRPLQLTATIPAAVLGTLDATGGGEALRTLPADVDATLGSGLVVAVADGTVTVDSSGQRLLTEPVPPAGSTYRVESDAGITRVLRDGVVVGEAAGLPAPQVAQLETGAQGRPEAAGLAVEIHTDARYQSVPSALKTGLLIAHGIALVALLALAWRVWPGRGPGLGRLRPSPADAVVLAVSVAWAFIGPVNIDDAWYTLMPRAAADSGYLGNYVYQFNVTENPFVLAQYAMQAWGQAFGWSLLSMRMLPLLYGLATYVLLRLLLATALGRAGRLTAVPWALAGAHLLWFLAYGITLRPETAIVVLSAAVMLLAELARRRESIGVLAVATAVAALAMSVSPTALVAVAPLVLALPWLWRWLVAAGVWQRMAAVLLAGASGSVLVPVGFSDATLGDVLEAVAVHRWYYRQHPWYDEFVHWSGLLAQADTGAWGKRLPVLLAVAVIVTTLVSVGRRRGTGGPTAALLRSSALLTTLAFASLAFTPTKWVNHFGAVAAPATLLLAVALVRTPLPRRTAPPVLWVGISAAVAAAAISYAGPNLWRPYGDWGQPFGNHADISNPHQISLTTPGVGPLELRNPLLWLLVVGTAVWWVRRRRTRALPPLGLTPDRAVTAVAVAGGVVLLLAAFTLAPIRQLPGASVASMNFAKVAGDSCGFANMVSVRTAADVGLGGPIGTAREEGDTTVGLPPDRGDVTTAPGLRTWHTDVPDGAGVGDLTSPWYPVPGGDPSDTIVVASTGDLRESQEVTLEFAGGDVRPDAPPDARVEFGPAGRQADWVDRTVVLGDLVRSGDLAERPTAVRVVARDRLGGDDTWLGVSAPWLAAAQSAGELLAGQPVFADQVSAVFWPCVEQIALVNGLVQAPAYRLRAADGLEEAIESNSIFAPNGGTLVPIDRTARFVELPSALDPPGGVNTLGWGHVERVVYDHPVGRFDVTVDQVTRDGWTRLPTLVGDAYTGRIYIG